MKKRIRKRLMTAGLLLALSGGMTACPQYARAEQMTASVPNKQQAAAENQRTAAENRREAAGNQQAATGKRKAVTGNQQPATGKRKASAEKPEQQSGNIVSSRNECRRFLAESVSQTSGEGRHELWVTGEDYIPETLAIAQIFPEVINISNTRMGDYEENGRHYTVCRIGFERKSAESGDDAGETDGDVWKKGDAKLCRIGNAFYRFRCIDDDYGDAEPDGRAKALFLCESVIRSDVVSTEDRRRILTFGETNNYRTSAVRSWLEKNLRDSDGEILLTGTGVNAAFTGKTEEGTFDEFSADTLKKRTLRPQILSDRLFLLSVEEALRYREELFETAGKKSAFDRGYWLRTPVYGEDADGRFCYGNLIYIVDLANGCIRPAEVSDGSIGIRPAFCLPQG